jgi:cytochrome P450
MRAWRKDGVLGALRAMRDHLGPVFQIPLPGFHPIVVSGPAANRFVLASGRHLFRWRIEGDPVVKLLRHGVLVEDGPDHDHLRRLLSPSLHRSAVRSHVSAMDRLTRQVASTWPDGGRVDMLVEMRRVTLLILVETLFGVDLAPDLDRLWPHIMRLLKYISPGVWVLWPGMPRFGYGQARRVIDAYLFDLIRARRTSHQGDDLLSQLVRNPTLTDDLIRDQMLTLLIAGHDTTTALLAWSFYLLGAHPDMRWRARDEVDAFLSEAPPAADDIDRLAFLENVVRETLRLYPPIHLGNRQLVANLNASGEELRAGERLLHSIYLTHRDPKHWPEPDRFDPYRFEADPSPPAYVYLPFGGGPRNCIGAYYGLTEAKTILARTLRDWDLELLDRHVHAHMGATLEPRPGVWMRVSRRIL